MFVTSPTWIYVTDPLTEATLPSWCWPSATLAFLKIGQSVLGMMPGILVFFNLENTEAALCFTMDYVSAHKSRFIMYFSSFHMSGWACSLTFATPLLWWTNVENLPLSALYQRGFAWETVGKHIAVPHVWVEHPKQHIFFTCIQNVPRKFSGSAQSSGYQSPLELSPHPFL